MDQTRITMCPKCDTTFRVSPAQLKLAKGAVRCGACLHVFYAAKHFQQNPTPAAPIQDDRTQDLFESPQIKKPQPVTSQHEESLFESNDTSLQDAQQDIKDDDFYIDDDIETGELAKEEDSNALIASSSIDDDDFLIDDHLDHQDNLIDDSDTERKTSDNNISDEFLSLSSDDVSTSFFTEEKSPHQSMSVEENKEEEAWAQALLDEDEESTTEAAVSVNTNRSENSENHSQTSLKSSPAFSYIQEDPLDLSLPQAGRKKKLGLWFLASAFLICVLMAQAAYFNFSQWARLDNLRPWYQLACEQLDCTLPSTYDVARIHTTASPQVSTHPRFHNALMIDILFINSAQYPQVFPRLELTFSDQNENVMAHRLFQPQEYLAGEAAGLTFMPVQTPIHIALEINDPGPTASNYQVRFLPPQ